MKRSIPIFVHTRLSPSLHFSLPPRSQEFFTISAEGKIHLSAPATMDTDLLVRKGEGDDVMVVDGSLMEGGGQILRTASVVAAVWDKRVRIVNIRGKRSRPGLRPQHLKGLEFIRDYCGGSMTGLSVGSCEVEYDPKGEFRERIARGDPALTEEHVVDVKTAGSCTLLLQSALPCLVASLILEESIGASSSKRAKTSSSEAEASKSAARGTRKLVLKGGTDVPHAPLADYATRVLAPALLDRLGILCTIQVKRRGFFPKGKGVLEVQVSLAGDNAGQDLRHEEDGTRTRTRIGQLETLKIVVVEGGKSQKRNALARTARKTAKSILKPFWTEATKVEEVLSADAESLSPGLSLVLVAEMAGGEGTLGSSAAMDLKKSWGPQIEACLGDLASAMGACARFDCHMQDQLLVLMALFKRRHAPLVCGPLTMHTRTAIELITRMLGEAGTTFVVSRCGDAALGTTRIECASKGIA